MAKKVYEETRIAAIAEKIREMTGTETRYNTSTMPEGIEEVGLVSFLAGMSEHNEAIEKNSEDIARLDEEVGKISDDILGVINSKGVANGIATLDDSGHIPSTQLPAYVDSVVEGYINADRTKFYEDAEKTKEIFAEEGKIYLDVSTLRTYRWGGTLFAEISESLALGETAASAFPGDKGKVAYDHSQMTSRNPHNVQLSDFGVTASANEINGLSGKIEGLSTGVEGLGVTTSELVKRLDAKANKSDIATTVYIGSAEQGPTYAKISDFGNWGNGVWYEKGFTMLITSRAGEMILLSLSSDDSNTNSRAIRLLDTHSKILEIYYSVSESAIYVKAAEWCNNICAHILSNINGDYVPTIAAATGLPQDAVQIQITEFGAGSGVTKIGASSCSLVLYGSADRPIYNNGATGEESKDNKLLALYNDVPLHFYVAPILAHTSFEDIIGYSNSFLTERFSRLPKEGDVFSFICKDSDEKIVFAIASITGAPNDSGYTPFEVKQAMLLEQGNTKVEEWTFTLDNGTQVTKKVVVKDE